MSEIMVGKFAIFRGLPVAVKEINGTTAKIELCVRLYEDDECSQSFREILSKNNLNAISLTSLKPFTHETAEELRKTYNKKISICNMVVHGIDECAYYM